MWRLAANYLMPEILRGSGALALGASVPTPLMVWWAAGFTVLTLLYADTHVPSPGFVAPVQIGYPRVLTLASGLRPSRRPSPATAAMRPRLRQHDARHARGGARSRSRPLPPRDARCRRWRRRRAGRLARRATSTDDRGAPRSRPAVRVRQSAGRGSTRRRSAGVAPAPRRQERGGREVRPRRGSRRRQSACGPAPATPAARRRSPHLSAARCR